jgi:hypothetical protein
MKIQSIKFMWKNCESAFTYSKPSLFNTGGGSYSDFGNYHVWNVQRHFYIWTYCFLTIKYRKIVK